MLAGRGDDTSSNGAHDKGTKQADDQYPCIHLKVKSQDGNELIFKIGRSTQLKHLMSSFSIRQSLDSNSIVFLFDGQRLNGEQTPDEVGMEDLDQIDAMLHQIGGGSATP